MSEYTPRTQSLHTETQVPFFPEDYLEAKINFTRFSLLHSAKVSRFINDVGLGAGDEELSTEVAYFGNESASRILFITSGTHGIEGYCGSAIQTGAIIEELFDDLPKDCAVVLVHALNPYGFSHNRRVNEENVDINRNFIDFVAGPRENPYYRRVHNFLVPPSWDGEARMKALAKRESFIIRNGHDAFQNAVFFGQHTHPDGICFGGTRPTWSNVTWRKIISRFAPNAAKIGHIDIHTGLGPFGFGELICVCPPGDTKALTRAERWYGADEITILASEKSSTSDVSGLMNIALFEAFPDASVTSISLEFGTVSISEMIEAICADNWISMHGDVNSQLGRTIKKNMISAFYPQLGNWRLSVWRRGKEVLKKAMKGCFEDEC